MTKSEFIKFLIEKEEVRGLMMPCWVRTYTNSDDHWKLNKPAVDWLEDDMNLSTEGLVKITYNKSLYDNDSAKVFETTYEDFCKNYDKTCR